ncbi:hypothetical protein EYF80_036312 [Liparis tanakae]|uniref:Uncharacterized protein n=1 Tax=Liparis tanakae TaxID=230148 RepID=A0A4Z2GJQ7_9TELE|nr:hypothetical protein EYF80_036312 [Liparis tanakae]
MELPISVETLRNLLRSQRGTFTTQLGVESVLDVALSHDAEVPDDFDGRVPQHVVLVVVQRLTGRHHDGFSSMNAEGGFVHEHLGSVEEGRRRQSAELLAIVGEARAQTAESKSGSHQDRVAEAFRRCHRLRKTSKKKRMRLDGGNARRVWKQRLQRLLTCSTDSAASLGATCSLISSIFSTKIFRSSVISIDATGVPRTRTLYFSRTPSLVSSTPQFRAV